VSLTTGRGPLGPNPAGTFSAPLPADVVYVEPFRRRVTAMQGDRRVVDSDRALLVHRSGRPPTYAFPASDATTRAAEPEWHAEGYVYVPWDAVDAWYEEDEQVFGHPRNPYHRVDCVRTSRRLTVEIAGVTIVDTTETMGVYETALEPCLYVQPAAVRTDLLRASATTTYCPYKGAASYWTAHVGDVVVEDAAWSYAQPSPECSALRDMLCFDPVRATLRHDLPTVD
jgi:uncharacterized protein (DUF427 family)